ncbi:carbohydrate-binding module family 13 protein, partial [Postia placenta MAD-698-R-SB12]
ARATQKATPTMTILPGSYRIENIGFQNYMDLAGGSSAQGTVVQGYTDAQNLNQLTYIHSIVSSLIQWTVEPVACISDNAWKIMNAASGTYAVAPVHAVNQGIVGGMPPDTFTFIDNDGWYQIKLADESLVLYLANGDDATQVADGSSNNQFWYMHPLFCTALARSVVNYCPRVV